MDRHRRALAGALCAFAVAAVPVTAQECVGPFFAAASLEAFEIPREAVVADFDGNGYPDVAAASSETNMVRVFLRAPSGGHTSQIYGAAAGGGKEPTALAADDVDGDGDVDLVVGYSFERAFTVFENDGAGLFTAGQTSGLGFRAGDLVFGDLDGDGDRDLVASGYGAAKELSVFLNDAGTLSWSHDYEVVGTPGSPVVADLDDDGALDLAVAAPEDGSVSVLWNTGAGVLSAPVRIPTPEWPTGLVAGDVTGDGRIDLLAAHQSLGQVALLANLGGRGFAPSLLGTGVPAEHLALGDLDQDGDLDLALSGPQWVVDVAWVFMNSGAGTFQLVQQVDSGDWPTAVALGDLDADGDPDLLLSDMMANSIRLFTNSGGRLSAAPRVVLAEGSPVQALAHGDVDGDGRPDLIAAQSAQVAVIGQLHGSTFGAPATYAAGAFLTDVAAADVDNDGDVDVVAADRDADAVVVLRNSAGLLGAPVSFAACDGPSALALEDMDGDGFRDVLVTCHPASTLRVLRNDGTGAFPTSTGNVFASASRPSAIATGDLDADGDRDVVVGLANSGRVSVLLRGPAGLSPGWTVTGCTGVTSVAVGDLNADGRPDIGASCSTGAQVRFYLNNGDATFTAGETPPVTKPATLRLVDLEGDGDLDLAVVRQSDDSVVTMRNDGVGHFTGLHAAGADENARALDAVDWDGDGDVDLASGSSTVPAVTTLLNTHVGCAAATLSAFGATVAEGDAGDLLLSFSVALSGALPEPATVDYATADGTAAADDYEPASGTLTFEPGEMQKTVTVVVHGDTAAEPDETVLLDVTSAIGNGQAAGTIVNDDGGHALVLDLSSVEGGSGFVSASLPGVLCEVQPGEAEQCVFDLDPNDEVTLIAQGTPGSGFVGWTGACSGTGECVVTMSEARQVGASFLGPRTLRVDLSAVEGGRGIVWVQPLPLDGMSTCDNMGQPDLYSCTFRFAPETAVTLLAWAQADSKFTGYTGPCTPGTPDQCLLTLSGPGPGPMVNASFLGPRTLRVDLSAVEGGRGIVWVQPLPLDGMSTCDNMGQPDLFSCTFRYRPDTEVTLLAWAHADSKFTGFTGPCTPGSPDQCTLTLSGPGPGPMVNASFLGPRTLRVDLSAVEGGRGIVWVQPLPLDGMSTCDNMGQPDLFSCTFRYRPDTEVTLLAWAHADSKFTGFTGPCTPGSPDQCTLTLSGPGPGPMVNASFLGPRTLRVDLSAVEGGRGIVWVQPLPLDGMSTCDNMGQPDLFSCTFRYRPDTEVTLLAWAHADSKFTGFTGPCTPASPDQCTLTLSGPGPGPMVNASFLGPRTLTVEIEGIEGGTGLVGVTPPGISAPPCDNANGGNATCTFTFAPGASVVVSAGAHPGSRFLGFDGACTGTSCLLSLTEPGPGPTVVARYLGPRTLTVRLTNVDGGSGRVSLTPAAPTSPSSSCDTAGQTGVVECTFLYDPGTGVTLSAMPYPDTTFGGWTSGGCSGTRQCHVQLSESPGSGAVVVEASFALANQPPVAHAGGPYAGLRGQPIAFDGSGSSDPDGQPLTYLWTFSDGGTATGVSPTHAFGTLGTHTASLVVSDGIVASPPSMAPVTIANALPSVTLMAPGDGSTHPEAGPIEIAADALDADGPVVRVAFYAGATLVGEAFAPPFTAAWSGAKAGTYTLTAQATDADGATTTSTARTVHLNPGPTVALTAPANGSVFVAGATVTLTATASDDLGVARVEFYRDATLIGTDTSRPYALAWSGVPAGRYVLTARAVDTTGGSAVSAPVTIDVVTVLSAAADSYVRDNSGGNDNYGRSTALETRTGSSGANRWTYLRFDIGSVPSVQSARLRLFGNLATTTGVAVQAHAFSAADVTWSELSIVWNNKPAPGTTVLASVPLVTSSTAARWYEWDLTAFLQAEKAAGRTAVTIVLKNDVATSPHATFRSRQAASNRPELQVTP